MDHIKKIAFLGLIALSACDNRSVDKSIDRGVNAHHVSTLVAGIWVDPDGCDHWIIDDGAEGYLSERSTPDGRPVCSGVAEPTMVVGPFKEGSPITDALF